MFSRLSLSLRPAATAAFRSTTQSTITHTHTTSNLMTMTAMRALSSSSSAGGAVHQGTVRAFDARRGYGFITPSDGSDDIFVHQTQVRRSGFRFLQTGEEVEFQMEQGDKGRKAFNVTGPGGEILPPRRTDGPGPRKEEE